MVTIATRSREVVGRSEAYQESVSLPSQAIANDAGFYLPVVLASRALIACRLQNGYLSGKKIQVS